MLTWASIPRVLVSVASEGTVGGGSRSLKEKTASLSSVAPMVPSHTDADLQHVIGMSIEVNWVELAWTGTPGVWRKFRNQ